MILFWSVVAVAGVAGVAGVFVGVAVAVAGVGLGRELKQQERN